MDKDYSDLWDYLDFMNDPSNSHHCENCPENQNFDSWEGKLPCGQQNCWVDVTCNSQDDR